MEGPTETRRAGSHKKHIDLQDFSRLRHASSSSHRTHLALLKKGAFKSDIAADSGLTGESMGPKNSSFGEHLFFSEPNGRKIFLPVGNYHSAGGTGRYTAAGVKQLDAERPGALP
jgi:hypothetical protein